MTKVEVGMVFSRLTVVSQFKHYKKWNCTCECGAITTVPECHLVSGNTKSCGCLKRDVTINRNTSHGMSHLPEYENWKGMIKRCFNPANKSYVNYAERGISVHEDFVKSFTTWLNEIGPCPKDEQRWSVGRKDNNAWYTYENMRWETDNQQARNHTKQKNNTSGIVGVAIRTTIISGKEYPAWVATWNTLDGKKYTKNFSINKYGDDVAKQMAIDFRNKRIEELNACGAEYAESHGTEK